MTLNLFLLVLACVFLFLAAFKTPEHPRLSFGWCGLAIFVLYSIFGVIKL